MSITLTVHENNGEWVLRIHHPNGSLASLGSLVGEEEARIVQTILQQAAQRSCEWDSLVTPELQESEGPYANFVAWERWIADSSIADIVGELSTTDRAALYGFMVDMMEVPGSVQLREYVEEVLGPIKIRNTANL